MFKPLCFSGLLDSVVQGGPHESIPPPRIHPDKTTHPVVQKANTRYI